jgi:hypothetical protein
MPAVRELDDARVVREELAPPRPERREPAAVAEKHEPKPAAAEPLGDVAAVDEAQLEQTARSGAADRDGTRVEPVHDAAADVEDDDHADPHADAHVPHAERPRRQQHERGMVSGLGATRKGRANVEVDPRSGCDPDASRPQPEPGCGTARRP